MSVLGLSILIASFSFFCYRCPPSSWLVLQWLRRPSLIFASKKTLQDTPSIHLPETSEETRGDAESEADGILEIQPSPKITSPAATKQDLDRKAMPPPPPPPKKPFPPSSPPTSPPNSPPTPRASSQPSFALPASPETEPDSIPSFPALNSAQRASGGRGPPRLNPPPSTGLMPPPPRSTLPLPNRAPLSSSLAPPPTHTTPPPKPQRKVLLTPGHSPLDWARLSSSPTNNLTGLPPGTPYLKVPPSLLKIMNGRKGRDAWTVLGGKVYNISPYAAFHPGGEPELMRAAGREGSRLFGEVHPWINWEGMLEGCLVGVGVEEGEAQRNGTLEDMD